MSERPVRTLTHREQVLEDRRQRRCELFDRVHQLSRSGQSIRQIAKSLGIDRETVTRYLRHSTYPERASDRVRRSNWTGADREFVERRVGEGRWNSAAIFRELQANGSRQSYDSVHRLMRQLLMTTARLGTRTTSTPSPVRLPSAKELSFVVIRRPENRSVIDNNRMRVLIGRDVEIDSAIDLATAFADMLRGQSAELVSDWLRRASQSPCPEMRGLARSLAQDAAAVQAAMTEPWSNGQVEGHVHRLKLMKRQMYGRAGLELLRARVKAAV